MTSSESTSHEVEQWRPSCSTFRAYHSTDQQNVRGSGRLKRLITDIPIVAKLTKDIVQTYRCCNASFYYSEILNPKRYLTNPSAPSSNGGLDNENNDLILVVNDVLVNEGTKQRYIIKDLLGHGTFGQVVKCWDDERNSFVAVKVIKNDAAYWHQANVEISILSLLNGTYDPDDKHHIVRIFEHFMYKKHLCFVFEMLGPNLYELLKANKLRGISLNLIRSFSKQILTALIVLRDARVIHCDLKPENMLLTTCLASAELKLIDFGSACRDHRTVYSYIQSRFYRSPEVVLGHAYTAAIDMWSFGCIVAELFLGIPLFPAESQYDLLQRMMEILGGRPPDHVLKDSKNTSKYFKQTGAPSRYSEGHRSAYQFLTVEDYVKREKTSPLIGRYYFSKDWDLQQIIMNYPTKNGLSTDEIEEELQKRLVFMDFIKGLVNFDPQRRWTPRQAAQHPFVTERPFTGSFQPPVEALQMPIHQGMNVDHNPGSGHWLGAGLSPQVNLMVPQLGSPHYFGHHFSYGSSHGSVGSYGSYSDGGQAGSFGDPYGGPPMHHQVPSAMLSPAFGIGQDARWHMGHHVPANQGLWHAHLGMSPSSNVISMSLGVSPSNLTPPSTSHFAQSPGSSTTGSPSRYGPTSPARSSGGGGASSLGKVAALGQFNKRWGSSASGGGCGGFESSNVSCNGLHSNTHTGNVGTSFCSHIEGASPLTSPRSFSDQGLQYRARNGMVSGEQTQASKLPTYPTGSLGALISNFQLSQHAGKDTSPGKWDPINSEDLLLESDEAETSPGSIPENSSSQGEPSGVQGLNVLFFEHPSGSGSFIHGTLQDGPQFSAYRQTSNIPHMEGGSQPLSSTFQVQHLSPSRLGQQSTHFLQQQQLFPYSSFNLHLYEQVPHLVPLGHHNLGSQLYFQGQMNGGLAGTFMPALSTNNRS